jgi:hypothetical protein
MPDINGIPYVEPGDLVSGYPSVSQSLAQEVNDQLASKADYPSGGSDGDIVTKSGTSTAWASPGDVGGLVLVTSATISGSATSVNSCFTSAYANYLLQINVTGDASNRILVFQLRASGVNETALEYNSMGIAYDAAGNNNNKLNSDSGAAWRIGQLNNSAHAMASFWIMNPAVGRSTKMHGFTQDIVDGDAYFMGYNIENSNSYDGFSISTTGTTSGEVRVYGYQNT